MDSPVLFALHTTGVAFWRCPGYMRLSHAMMGKPSSPLGFKSRVILAMRFSSAQQSHAPVHEHAEAE